MKWDGVRGTKPSPVQGKYTLYGFLNTEPNALVKPIHSKLMSVILTTPEKIDTWLSAP